MRGYYYWVVAAAILAFSVIVAGAWVRLTDAGLGCPDWPGCYGQLVVPDHIDDVAEANSAFPQRPLEAGKAWREMIHRYMASTLGLIIVGLAIAAWRRRHDSRQPVTIPFLLVLLVIFQGLLGMWTVTLLLKPLIVMGHLLGGIAIFSLLVWLALQTRYPDARKQTAADSPRAKRLIIVSSVALLVLLVQISLGGWTSTNYAALACPDFPTCQAQWIPAGADYREAFVMWRGLGVDYEGGVLEHPARVAIHFVHRLGAIVASVVLIWAALSLLRGGSVQERRTGFLIKIFLLVQVTVGIVIVKYALPLGLAVAHNGNATLLMASVVAANFYARRVIHQR